MEVYAAQIDRMDQNIGHLLDALDETGQLENTLLLFLSDNGGCDEVLTNEWRGIWMARETHQGHPVVVGNENTGVLPGPEATYMSYGPGWANVSNTPLRQYKWWTHQGGIVTPFIVHWPSRIPDGGLVMSEVGSVLDLMATAVDAASAAYPTEWNGVPIHPMEGRSLLPAFHGKPLQLESLFWEHEGNRAVRSERWKLVATRGGDWELYNLKTDRSELNNLAEQHLTEKDALITLYNTWANRVGVSEDPIF
jgi:arylsulfatase